MCSNVSTIDWTDSIFSIKSIPLIWIFIIFLTSNTSFWELEFRRIFFGLLMITCFLTREADYGIGRGRLDESIPFFSYFDLHLADWMAQTRWVLSLLLDRLVGSLVGWRRSTILISFDSINQSINQFAVSFFFTS